VSRLQREYDQEVAHSLKLQKEARPAASAASAASRAAPAVSSEESEKDHITIALYEDLTAMSVLRVAIRPTAAGKEKVFHCVQTADDRSESYVIQRWMQASDEPECLRYPSRCRTSRSQVDY
jgi:hypothetical protein